MRADALKQARRALDKGDAPRAVALLERAADDGEPEAFFLLGGLFQSGLGVAPSQAKAAALYKLAGDSGHGPSLLALARMAHDPAIRLDLMLKAAAAGIDDAMVEAAEMLAAGTGASADPARARSLMIRAAEAGNPAGMARLGAWLRDGLGGPADAEEALAWLYAAVALGADEAAQVTALAAAENLSAKEIAAARLRGRTLAKAAARH